MPAALRRQNLAHGSTTGYLNLEFLSFVIEKGFRRVVG